MYCGYFGAFGVQAAEAMSHYLFTLETGSPQLLKSDYVPQCFGVWHLGYLVCFYSILLLLFNFFMTTFQQILEWSVMRCISTLTNLDYMEIKKWKCLTGCYFSTFLKSLSLNGSDSDLISVHCDRTITGEFFFFFFFLILPRKPFMTK